MFKQKYLNLLIIVVPILFIIITTSVISLIQYYEFHQKNKNSTELIKNDILKNEENKASLILDSINSYINFKKATSINILKNNIKSKVLHSQSLLNKIDIKSKSSTSIELLSSISKLKDSKNYFIYKYKNKSDKFLLTPNRIVTSNNEIYSNQDFVKQFINLLKNKDEGFILYTSQIDENSKIKNEIKLAYVKNFDNHNLVVGYSIFLADYDEITQKEVLNRLNLMKIPLYYNIFTLNEDKIIIQDLNSSESINKKFINLNNDNTYLLDDYLKKSKVDLIQNKYEFIWEKEAENKYKLYIFDFIKSWDWLVSISLNINNLDEQIKKELEINNQNKKELIYNLVKHSLFVIIIFSIISYFISSKIISLILKSRQRDENQKNALKNMNASLLSKMQEKYEPSNELISYSKFKMDFISNIVSNLAHLWREKLNSISIISSSSNLKIETESFDRIELKNDFEKIIIEAQKLSNSIENIKDIFTSKSKVELINLKNLVETTLILIDASLQNNYIKIEKEFDNVQAYCMKAELCNILLNIITFSEKNLLNSKNKEKTIYISIFNEKDKAYIVIKDNFDNESSNIFDKGYEDLSISKGILENLMNSKLEISYEKNIFLEKEFLGNCFKMELPLEKNNY